VACGSSATPTDRADHPGRERADRKARGGAVRGVEAFCGVAHPIQPRPTSAARALVHAIAVPTPKQTRPCSASRASEKVAASPAGSSARRTAAKAEQRAERRRLR
jgi:hypothetical protein